MQIVYLYYCSLTAAVAQPEIGGQPMGCMALLFARLHPSRSYAPLNDIFVISASVLRVDTLFEFLGNGFQSQLKSDAI